jgi:hypothetical protein
MRVANLISFSCQLTLGFVLLFFARQFLFLLLRQLALLRLVLEFLDLLALVDDGLDDVVRRASAQPSIRSTAAIASGLSRMRRRVSLSTFTSSADSHLRVKSVADAPAIALSKMPAASI